VQVGESESVFMANMVEPVLYLLNILFFKALALKNIEYEYHAVNLIKNGGEQHSSEHKKLNPKGEIPVLFIDSHNLIQSVSF
jgi:glutaredoxin